MPSRGSTKKGREKRPTAPTRTTPPRKAKASPARSGTAQIAITTAPTMAWHLSKQAGQPREDTARSADKGPLGKRTLGKVGPSEAADQETSGPRGKRRGHLKDGSLGKASRPRGDPEGQLGARMGQLRGGGPLAAWQSVKVTEGEAHAAAGSRLLDLEPNDGPSKLERGSPKLTAGSPEVEEGAPKASPVVGGGASKGSPEGVEGSSLEQGLSDYELARLRNIERNRAMMEALGLGSAVARMSAIVDDARARKKAAAAQKGLQVKRKREEGGGTPVVLRRSMRVQGVTPVGAAAKGVLHERRDGSVIVEGGSSWGRQGSGTPSDVWRDGGRPRGPVPLCAGEGLDSEFVAMLRDLKDDLPQGKSHGTPSPAHSSTAFAVDPRALRLAETDVAKVVKDRIFTVAFLPTADRIVAVAGDKNGGVGLWDVDAPEEDDTDGVHNYRLHSQPVSGLVVPRHDPTRLLTCSFDGSIRVMDVETGLFTEVLATEREDFSALCLGGAHLGDDHAFVADGDGGVTGVDLRSGSAMGSFQMHRRKINSIEFHPHHPFLLATASTDTTVSLWDARKLPVGSGDGSSSHFRKAHHLTVLGHGKGANSAYFSPDGTRLLSTSYDNYVRIWDGVDELHISGGKADLPRPLMISHDNNTGRWVSSFRAVWAWDSQHCFVGNMRRGIDAIDVKTKVTSTLASEVMTTIPARLATHPVVPGIVAGATGGGKLFIWRSRQ